MGETNRRVLFVKPLEPFCAFSMSRDERNTLLRHVDRVIDNQRTDVYSILRAPGARILRPVIEQSYTTLILDQSNHSRLSTILIRVMDSEDLLERFREATPECYWCGDSPNQQIRFHDSDLVLVCSECFETIDSSNSHHLLQDLDPTITPSTEITCLDTSSHRGTDEQQASLLQFTTSD